MILRQALHFLRSTVTLTAVLFFTLPSDPPRTGSQARKDSLLPRHREWLEIVTHIILPQEEEVFLRLADNRERDIFVESFWKQRDPTPGTPRNEFREEHLQRVEYARTRLRRGSARDGSRTDMGRIYILLGKPLSIDSYVGKQGLRPCELWTYHGDETKGLPVSFGLIFFQEHGAGEFKLYQPGLNSPLDLIELATDKTGLGSTENREAYLKLQRLAPALAPFTLSPIPGTSTYAYMPSPRSNQIFAAIQDLPHKTVNPSYATHFLNYRGIVSTEYLTNYVDNETAVAVAVDVRLGLPFVHLSITPKSLSVDFYEARNQHYCTFTLDLSLRRGETVVYQASKEFPFYFSPTEAERIKSHGVTIQDSFPVVPGSFRLSILLRNSVGKEFTVAEQDLTVEGDGTNARIFGLVLGTRIEPSPEPVHLPFRFGDLRLIVDPKATFAKGEDVVALVNLVSPPDGIRSGSLRLGVGRMDGNGQPAKVMTIKLEEDSGSSTTVVPVSIPSTDLPPAYYVLTAELLDSADRVQDTRTAHFAISPETSLPHPSVLAQSFPLANRFLFQYLLAGQHAALGETAPARALYEKALAQNPDFKDGIAVFANFLIEAHDFDRALAVIEGLKDDPEWSFAYRLGRGKAAVGKGDWTTALQDLQEANRIYNSDVDVLNLLGLCFQKTGQKARAREVLEASLRLNPDQPAIRRLLEDVGKPPQL